MSKMFFYASPLVTAVGRRYVLGLSVHPILGNVMFQSRLDGNPFKFGTNKHLDSKMNLLGFGGQMSL